MDTVLVTGATGFIGKYLVQHLIQNQLRVRVLVRSIQKAISLPIEVEIYVGDLTNPTSLAGVCSGIDTVFHLGGYAHAWQDKDAAFAAAHHNINYVGTKNILAESIESDVKRFIFFSSVKAVADTNQYIDETWEQFPSSPYGIAKRESEQLVLAAKNSGLHVCVLRPALVYGPQWKGNLASMLHAIDRGLFLPPPEVNNHRSLISVADLCHAARIAAYNPNANGKVFFVTDGIDYSTRQLYSLICEALGKRIPKWSLPIIVFKLLARVGDFANVLLKRRAPFDSEALSKLFGNAYYNSERIQHDLGFKPEYDLKKMLPEIIDSYRTL